MYYSGSTPGLFSEADDNAWTFHSRELFDQGFFFLNDVGYRVLLRGQHLDFSVGQTITPGLFTPVNYSTKSPAYIYFFLYDCWVSCTTPGSTPGLFSGADDNTWTFHSCELFNQGSPAITRPRFLRLTTTSLFLPVVIHQATVRHRSKSTLGETWGGHKLSPKANNGKEFAGWGRVET